MRIDSLNDMYLAELQEIVNAERQLADSLLPLVERAVEVELQDALTSQFKTTEAQVFRLESILRAHGTDTTAHTDQGMQALLAETEKMHTLPISRDVRDAGLIASLQKLVHYQIAAYGTAAALAGHLGLQEDHQSLADSLEEEKATDALLTELANTKVNPSALAG